MATIIDHYILRASLNARAYVQGASQIAQANNRIQAYAGTGYGGALARMFAPALAIGLVTGYVAAVVAAGGELISTYIKAGEAASQAAADFEVLTKGLESVEGGAGKAGDALNRLKELAKAPGLGFEESVTAYIGLRNSGASQPFAEKLIREFANANMRSGGDRYRFSRMMLALKQALNKGYLQGNDPIQLSEAGIPVYAILHKAFGTSDTAELKKKGITAQQVMVAMLAELEKMPRVAGGARNSFDNLADAMNYAKVQAGQTLNDGLSPLADKLDTIIRKATEGGAFSEVFGGLQSAIEGVSFDEIKEGLIDILAFAATVGDGIAAVFNAIRGAAKAMGIDLGDAVRLAVPPWLVANFNAHKRGIRASFDLADAKEEAQRKREARNGKAKAGLSPEEEANQHLATISKNTKETSDVLKRTFDAQQRVIGGGQIGQGGLYPNEVYQIGHQRRVSGKGQAAAMLTDLMDILARYISANSSGEYDRRAVYDMRGA